MAAVKTRSRAPGPRRAGVSGSSARAVDGFGLLLENLGSFPVPDRDKEASLARRVAAGDADARREMVESNLRLVVYWARCYQNRGVELADLVQEGTFGLTRAVEKFQCDRGFRFSTYASFWIRQSLQRAVQQYGRTIRIPAGVSEQIRRLEAIAAQLAAEVGRQPTEGELSEATKMDPARRRACGQVAQVVASLDQPAALDSLSTLGDLLAANDAEGVDRVDAEMTVQQVRQAVEDLPAFQREVVKQRFGFGGDPPASLRDVAARLGVGPRRVQHAERAALAALSMRPAIVGAWESG